MHYFFFISVFLREEESFQHKTEHSTETGELRSDTYLETASRSNHHWIEDHEHSKKLLQELLAIKQQNNNLQRSFETLKRDSDNEIRILRNEIIDARFKMQVKNDKTFFTNIHIFKAIESNHNESFELYQSEIKQLKNDLNLIGTRMDYQYNVRFKKIEESVEGAQNRLYQVETKWHENAERLLGAGQNVGSAVMLSCLNICVEFLKVS